MISDAPRPQRWQLIAVALPFVIAVGIYAEATKASHRDPRLFLAAAVIGAAVAAAVWLAPPAWCLCAAFALSIFGANWQTLGLPRLIAPDRIVLGLTLVAIAIRAPGSAQRPPIRFRPLYGLMYVAGVYALGSALAEGTLSSHNAVFDLLDRMQILDWIVFIVAPAAFATHADRRVLMATMVGMGLYLGFTGIFEIIGPHALVFPRYINNPNVGIQFGRARGPFVQATINGMAMYACAMAALIAYREWRGRLLKALALLTFAVCAFSLLLTFQRTVWLGVAISAVITMLVVRELRKYLLPVALAVVAVTGFAYVSSSTVRSHLQTRAGDVETVRDRQAIDGAALNMLTHRPLFGFGWGRFQAVEFNYVQPSDGYSLWNRKPIPVHNVYLSIATDLGLVGASMWLLILLFGIGGAVVGRRGPPELRAWRILLGTLSVMWLVAGLSSPLSSSFQSLIIWLLAALVVGGANAYEPRAEPPAGLPDGAGGRNRLRHELPFRYRADAVG